MLDHLQQNQTQTITITKVKPTTQNSKQLNQGWWAELISLGRTTVTHSFEVFPSGGSLVGKPMQQLFGTIHNHTTDKVSIPHGLGHEVLVNKIHNWYAHMCRTWTHCWHQTTRSTQWGSHRPHLSTDKKEKGPNTRKQSGVSKNHLKEVSGRPLQQNQTSHHNQQ